MPSKSGPPTKGALVEVDGRYRFARKERNPVSSALRILRVAQCLVAGVFLPKTCPRGPPLRWFRTGQRSLHCRVCFLLKLGVARRVKFVPGSVLSVLSLQSSPGHATHSGSSTSICAAQKHWQCGCPHSFSTSLYACGSGPTIVRHQGLARSTSNGSML